MAGGDRDRHMKLEEEPKKGTGRLYLANFLQRPPATDVLCLGGQEGPRGLAVNSGYFYNSD